MSRSKRSIWQVNLSSQCQKTACRKEASGNMLHHHTPFKLRLAGGGGGGGWYNETYLI